MLNRRQMDVYFQKVRVIRAPKRRLATFGTSRIDYQLVSEVSGLPDRARLRLGLVTAERPQIITPQSLREKFEGFGPDSARYADALVGHYGEALRGLEYKFRNEPGSSRLELRSPDALIKELSERHDADGGYHTVLLRGTENFWELAVMKFIVEETLASFKSNVRELEEHGLFDPQEERQHREIRALFQRARADQRAVPLLAAKLKEYGLFESYQDEFFRLVNP